MIDYLKIFSRINSLPFLPRMIFYCAIIGIVMLMFWTAADPASRANTLPLSPTPTLSMKNPISPLLFGTNLGLFSDNDQVLTSASTRKLFQQIHVQAIRIPVRSGLSEATMIKAARTVKDMGVVPVVALQGPTDSNVLTDDVKTVSDMTRVFGNSTVYYEFGNEEDLMNVSAQHYTALWNVVIPLLKKLAPKAQFVGPVTFRYDQNYLTTFLKDARPRPDVVSWHEYTCVASDSKDTCIAHIDSWSTHIANARTTMTTTISNQLPIMISEWNYAPEMVSSAKAADDGKSNDTIFLSTWAQKAFQTLAANRVFASMQYFSTGSVPLVDSKNNLAVQGMTFQAMYNSIIKPTPTPEPKSTATASSTGEVSLMPTSIPTAAVSPTNIVSPTPTPMPTTVVSPTSTMSPTPPPTLMVATSPTPPPTTAASPTATSSNSMAVVATDTPTPTPQNLYMAISNTNPAYISSLVNQDNAQWQTGSFGQGGSCVFTNSAYIISIYQKNDVGLCESDAISTGDFVLQVQMILNRGDGGGIAFRDNGKGGNYRFRVNADGTYDLGNQTTILASGSSPAIKTGANQSNVLAVIARGSQISLFANGQLLTGVNDSTSDTGKIGLFAVDITHSTTVMFNNLKIWTLVTPGTTPTATTGLIPTVTPPPINTPILSPTLTTQQLYTQVTGSQPSYTTTLAGQDSFQWLAGATNGGGCNFSPEGYTVNLSQSNVVVCDANASSVSNFALQVSMRLTEGDGGGIVFRDNGHGFYRFRVSSDGTFDLVNQKQGIAAGISSAIKQGANQTNVLTVIAQDTNIFLYVNGQLIANVQDNTSVSGKMGLFVVDFAHPTTAVFTDLNVWVL